MNLSEDESVVINKEGFVEISEDGIITISK
jgi:hypothetical protein